MARRSKKQSPVKMKPRKTAAPAAAAVSGARKASAIDGADSIEKLRAHKIFPRNLTARAAYLVPGNPAITRPEDAVANCFPGLEIDLRNLDRRFFPGLVFEFIEEGARLAYVDLYLDPDLKLPEAKRLYQDLDDNYEVEGGLTEGTWFLDSIEQKGVKHSMRGGSDVFVWRMVRSLEPGLVKIVLREQKTRRTLALEGLRRRFTDPETGVINGAYQPGELMQGLCSPWQHDFRDCSCFYWAANRPDIVLSESYPGDPDKGDAGVPAAGGGLPPVTPGESDKSMPLDWLRSDRARDREAEALETIEKNRPFQLDHFQVNQVWQTLNVVVEGREVGGLYVPQTIETTNPLASPGALATELARTLGPLEIALTFEYLYARSSLISENEALRKGEDVGGAVILARDRLLMIAASEMQHLRWVNQMLWELFQAKLLPHPDFADRQFKPILVPATTIPSSSTVAVTQSVPRGAPGRTKRLQNNVEQFIEVERAPPEAVAASNRSAVLQAGKPAKLDTSRPAELRSLFPRVINDFIAVEHPSAAIDGAYAKVIATLRDGTYPKHLVELALRISGDGVQHEKRFREVREALSLFFGEVDAPNPRKEFEPIYLRQGFKEGTPQQAAKAAEPLRKIKQGLRQAYLAASKDDFAGIAPGVNSAKAAMMELLALGEEFANRRNIGIPYFTLWNAIP